jgi:hypothetical protein
MILEPVILVLGAGASQPYGYPLGGRLREILCAPSHELATLVTDAGHDRNAIAHFAEEFGYSNLASIDVFLERQPKLAALGRAMIAGAILQLEPAHLSGDWYAYLWQQLSQDAPTLEQFKRNDLKVITFNYDTSFERFIVNSIRASYDVTLDEAKTAFQEIPVIHVHGYIPFKLAARFLTPSPATSTSIRASSDKIVTLHEGQDHSKEFKMARYWLQNASRVIFLGFGYHPANVRRLRVQDWLNRDVIVRGSTKGLVGQETGRVMRLFYDSPKVILEDRDCLDMLRHNVAIFDK